MDEEYRGCELPPPIQTSEFVTCSAWTEACAKYGHDPLEFLHYLPTGVDRQEVEEVQAHTEMELEEYRREYDIELTRLLAIIAHDPARVRRVLAQPDDECKEWCCAQPTF